jgi:hypothetical protein
VTTTQTLSIEQGKTFQAVVRWEVEPLVFKSISAMVQTAPARITCTAHGMPDGWRGAVVDAKGMTELNAKKNPPAMSDFHRMSVVDANTVTIDDLSSASFRPYKGGGFLAYYTAPDLTGFTARMSIKDKVDGELLHSLTTENGGITIDADENTIALEISATDTAAFDWKKGVYDLEMVDPDGVVTAILKGTVHCTPEVTT